MTIADRSHLENSRPLQWTRRARTEAEEDAVAHFMGVLEDIEDRQRKRREEDRNRLRATMEAIILDLYCAAKEDPSLFLAYSRRKEDYGPGKEHPEATLTTVCAVVGFLESAGYVVTHKGSYSRRPNPFGAGDTGTGYRSRIRAQPLLVDMLEGVFGVTPAGIGSAPKGNLIRLKAAADYRGAAKQMMKFRETEATAAMRQRLAEANALRAHAQISVDGPLPRPKRGQKYARDLSELHLHRVFNNARWDHGGRFFGGWWQIWNKADRARIHINGEPTVELDFQAYQPRICFHLAGCPLPLDVDPYAIPGIDTATYREATKKAVGQLMNVGPNATPKRPTEFKHLFPTQNDYTAFIRIVEAALQPIQQWLRNGRGMELQFIDSEITDATVTVLTAQGIPCLPIHDSFIVPCTAEAAAGRAMCMAYHDQLLERTGIRAYPAIAGWTSPEVERQVRSSLTPLTAMPIEDDL